MGNPTAITGSIVGVPYSPSFAYQDHLYFLTQGNGPWGNRAWTYDKIGNRLAFAKTSEPTQSYAYSGTGHNPKLATVTPAPGWGTGSWAYSYDAAGNQTSVLESNDEGAVQTTFYDAAADGRMSALRTDTGPARTDFLYDGRGYLRRALLTVADSIDNLRVAPVYSSDGMLMERTEERQWTGATIGPDGEDQLLGQVSTETTQVFYFAGRPVAQLTSGPELLYLTTDHIGTPVLATDTSGAAAWAGGVEPFGTTWTAGTDNSDPAFASAGGLHAAAAPALSRLFSEKVFLRYPGQWMSDVFRASGMQQEIYYNLHRWHGPQTGRYSSPDPLGLAGDSHLYRYAMSSPLSYVDPTGLQLVVPPNHPYRPDPFNPLPSDCVGGPVTFSGYEYRTTVTHPWTLHETIPISIPRIARAPAPTGRPGTNNFELGCTCIYMPGGIFRTTQLWSRWTQTVTCPPCRIYERTLYNYEQTYPPVVIPVIFSPTMRRARRIFGECRFCPETL